MGKVHRPKIGLALGSGGARGYAHIGVLKVLEQEKIPIDYLAGSSMGALVASLYGAGHPTEHLIRFANLFKRKYYLDFTVPKMGFIAGHRVEELIRVLAKKKRVEELDPPVRIVAADLLKGERVILQEGDVAEAVRASIAIPGIFVPKNINDRLLIDGGVIDRVPVSVVKEMGADLTIAVDLTIFREELEIRSVYDVILQTMDMMSKELVRVQEIDCTVMIRPMNDRYRSLSSSIDFEAVNDLILLGEQAAIAKIPEIKDAIAKWKETHYETDEKA